MRIRQQKTVTISHEEFMKNPKIELDLQKKYSEYDAICVKVVRTDEDGEEYSCSYHGGMMMVLAEASFKELQEDTKAVLEFLYDNDEVDIVDDEGKTMFRMESSYYTLKD